ncbi:unnamed protein product [Cochlearia groenlandica]
MVSTRESAYRGQSSQSQSVSDNIQDNWSDEDIQNYNMLLAREIYPTRFLDGRVLLKQGIKEQMEDLLDRMGTKILMTMEEPTYPELTHQFLATVGYEEQESGGKVNFKLGGVTYSIQFLRFCELYGLTEARSKKDTLDFRQE